MRPMPASDRRPLTRDVVVASARELVAAEGVAGVSLRGLARLLGVTAPALYAYVEDREDLLRAVAQDALGQLAERFDSIEAEEPLDRLREQCRCYIDFACENPDLFGVMFLFPPELPGAAPLGIESDAATSLFLRATGAIDAAVAAGDIAPLEDPIVAALSMWATVHGTATVLTMGFDFDDRTRARLVEQAVRGVLATFGAET